MGWEVFHQVILIPTPIRLIEITSKRESNCNVMITGLVDHKLHVVLSHELNPRLTRDLSTSSFNPHRLRYELFFTPSHCRHDFISLVPTRPLISNSSFWSRSPTRRRLFADQRFSGSGGSGARGVSSHSTKESH